MKKKFNIDKIISKLDTAGGMLLVDSLKNPEIKKAWEIITEVSLELGELAE